jgi:hypothetical protein
VYELLNRGKTMSKRYKVWSITCLFGLLAGGGLLFLPARGFTESLQGGLAIVGFLIFFASVGGIIKIMVDVTRQRGFVSEIQRPNLNGNSKWAFVLKFVALTALPIVILLGLFMTGSASSSQIPSWELKRNFIVVAAVFVGLGIFSALRFWSYSPTRQTAVRPKEDAGA